MVRHRLQFLSRRRWSSLRRSWMENWRCPHSRVNQSLLRKRKSW